MADDLGVSQEVDRSSKLPTAIATSGKLSPTSDALTCFREQKFCARLQVFLVSYVVSVNSYYSVYK